MANMFAYRWSWLPLSLLFYLDLSLFLTAQARRFGSNSKTIHLPETGSDLYNVDDRTRILKVDPNFVKNRLMSMLPPDETLSNNDNVGDNKIRKKREASSPFLTNMTTEVRIFHSFFLLLPVIWPVTATDSLPHVCILQHPDVRLIIHVLCVYVYYNLILSIS